MIHHRFIATLLLLSSILLISSCTAPDSSEIFIRENCSKCHRFKNLGDGPIDINKVAEARTEGWIRDQIKNPRLHKPDSGMPSFGHLSEREINALIEMFRNRK